MRINQTFFLTPGIPINVGTGTSVSDGIPRLARRVFAQMRHGSSGLGFVMDGIGPKRMPSASQPADLTAELGAATSATGPGQSYQDTDKHGINVTEIWIDGTVAKDQVLVSWVPLRQA